MLKILTVSFVMLSTVSMAHEQECFTPEQMDKFNKEYNQVPVFTTSIYKFVNGHMVQGDAEFFLNVEEGHWTMYSTYKDGESCIEASGDNFKDVYKGK